MVFEKDDSCFVSFVILFVLGSKWEIIVPVAVTQKKQQVVRSLQALQFTEKGATPIEKDKYLLFLIYNIKCM